MRDSWERAREREGEEETESRVREREQGHTTLHISASINLVFVILLNID